MKKILGLVTALCLFSNVMQAGYGLYYGEDTSPVSKKVAKNENRALLLAQKKAQKQQEIAQKKVRVGQEKALKTESKRAESAQKKMQAEREKALNAEKKRIKAQEKLEAEKIRAAEKAAGREQRKLRKDREKAEKAIKIDERERLEKLRKEEDKRTGRWDFIYKTPAWEFCATPYEQTDLADLRSWLKYENESFSSSGHTQDMSNLPFGESTIRVQDILLTSKLLADGKMRPVDNSTLADYYLYYLRNEEISFKGEVLEVLASFNFARHMFNKDLSVGFQIPFASRRHELNMRTNLTAANATRIEASGTTFPSEYNQSFNAFIEDILSEKQIGYSTTSPKTTENGLSDITVFMNLEIKSKHVERLMVGLNILCPTARDRNIHKLWDPELGNGGFFEVAPYIALLYSHSNWFNPHLFVKATYDLPAKVDRRVPRYRSFDGSDAGGTTLSNITGQDLDDIVFSDKVETKPNGTTSIDWASDDTTIRGFSTQTDRIRLHPGGEFNFRIGNMFDGFIDRRGTLDVFYDLWAKGKDYSGATINTNMWSPSVVTKNSFRVHHKIGLNMSYQFDKHFRSQLGGLYTFAGRNVPMTYQLITDLSMDF